MARVAISVYPWSECTYTVVFLLGLSDKMWEDVCSQVNKRKDYFLKFQMLVMPIYYPNDANHNFFSLFETRCYYIAQDDLVLIILLPQLPKRWDYRCVHHVWFYPCSPLYFGDTLIGTNIEAIHTCGCVDSPDINEFHLKISKCTAGCTHHPLLSLLHPTLQLAKHHPFLCSKKEIGVSKPRSSRVLKQPFTATC